jgi:hypothetical protein
MMFGAKLRDVFQICFLAPLTCRQLSVSIAEMYLFPSKPVEM